MKIKNLLSMLFVAVCGGIISVFIYTQIFENRVVEKLHKQSGASLHPYFQLASHDLQSIRDVSFPDLTYAAEKAVHCVVHVRVKTVREGGRGMFGQNSTREQEGFGSGVIISPDGYIVTNNHVVRRTNEIEVALDDGRVFNAKIVGADPSTDIALLKIEETNLPFLTFGDSEALRVGEWVLAVGNPLGILTSTVTAGIVSAKSRNFGYNTNLYRGQIGLEAFIQTDAAINSGNSGGALVNIRGELVGINTLILSQTHGFTGNSFAIPSIIVQSVTTDLKEFGSVQRARLGLNFAGRGLGPGSFSNETPELTVVEISDNFGAAEAGMKINDVITAINDVSIRTFGEFQEQIVKYRPGDIVKISVIRDNKTQHFNVTLRNSDGTTEVVRDVNSILVLGARFESVPQRERQSLGINSGVRVRNAGQGSLSSYGISDNFIITAVNDKPVNSARDIQTIIDEVEAGGRILINAISPLGQVQFFAFAK